MKKVKESDQVSLANMNIPTHVAFIMDGNGRWAKNRGLPRKMGHVEGVEALKRVLRRCHEVGIKFITVFAFSTENWNRPKDEVDGLMKLTKQIFKKNIKDFIKDNVRIRHIGDLEHKVPKDVKESILSGMAKTKHCTGMTFNFAFNYGGRNEIVNAVNNIIKSGKKEISEQEFDDFLYTKGEPDPDLIIRTSGEQRVSNFMMWQMAYSEFLFIADKHWPDFAAADVDNIIVEYNKRNRRFGAIKE